MTLFVFATVAAGIHSVGGDVRSAKGTDVILTCPHVGLPEPTITWRRNNAPVTREARCVGGREVDLYGCYEYVSTLCNIN